MCIFVSLAVNTRRSHFVYQIRGKYVGRIVKHSGGVLEQRAENYRTHGGADRPSRRGRFRDGHQTSDP